MGTFDHYHLKIFIKLLIRSTLCQVYVWSLRYCGCHGFEWG